MVAAALPALAFAAPPPNDNFAGAAQLAPDFGTFSGTNVEATDETAAGEPDHAASGFGAAHSVWYKWTPAADMGHTFDTCGSTFDTRLAIYVGGSLGGLSQIAANDDAGAGTNCPGDASQLSSFFSSGTVYYIAVDTSGPIARCGIERGPFQLRLDGVGAGTEITCGSSPPAKPAASISDTAVFEGNSGQVDGTFTVSLDRAAPDPFQLGYTTVDKTATAPGDFMASSGTINFGFGDTSKTITVKVNGDVADEPNEAFEVHLTSPSPNATIADGVGQLTIVDDDDPAPGEANPSVPFVEEPFTFKMPRFAPTCKGVSSGSKKQCGENSTNYKFRTLTKARETIAKLRAAGADVRYVESPKGTAGYSGNLRKALLAERLNRAPVISQNIDPKKTVTTTTSDPLIIKLSYYDYGEDVALEKAIADAVKKQAKAKQPEKVKSKCQPIASGLSTAAIAKILADRLSTEALTQKEAGRIFKELGCGYEVSKYVDGPGFSSDIVLDVTGVDPKRDLILIKVALPVAQDFLITLREDPTQVNRDDIGIASDASLTVSGNQLNSVTAQVLQRSTGDLVANAEITFVGPNGTDETKRTDGNGEATFASKFTYEQRRAIQVRVRDKSGESMQGFREIKVVDRKGQPFTTMSGRALSLSSGRYVGTDGDLARSRALPLVPANIGTGLAIEPTRIPKIVQGPVLARAAGGGLITGQHNVVSIPNDSSFLIGAGPGRVAFGGGLPDSVSRRKSPGNARFLDFFTAARLLFSIVDGLNRSASSGTGTVAKKASAEDKAKIATTKTELAKQTGLVSSGLISDKGLGFNSKDAGRLISDKGLGFKPVPGGGSLISDGGSGLIGDHGTGVISTGGCNATGECGAMPVYGGNGLIGQAGGN